jgi:hypothetical protein
MYGASAPWPLYASQTDRWELRDDVLQLSCCERASGFCGPHVLSRPDVVTKSLHFLGEKVFPTFWPTLSSDMLHDKRLAVLHIYCLIRSPFDILIMLPTPLCGMHPLNYISWISIRHLLVIKDGVLRRLLELHENGNVLETTLNQLYEGTCVSLIIQSID